MQTRLRDFPALIVHWMPSAGKKLIVPIGTKGFFNLHIIPSLLLIHCLYTCLTPCLALSSLYCAATSLKRMPDLSFSIASIHLPCFSHKICRTYQKIGQKKGVIHNQQNLYSFNGGLKVTMWLHIIILQVLETSLNSTIICILYYMKNYTTGWFI